MKRPSWRQISTEAKLLLVGIPVFLWTVIPIYHLFLFAISPKDSAFAGRLWPDHPTLRNFEVVFRQQHYYLSNFWVQLGNSLLIAVAVGAITLFVATAVAFAISRLKARGGRTVMNLALFTYFIPATFLAVPMYKTMSMYGLLNNRRSLILAMVTIAAPYSNLYAFLLLSNDREITLAVALGNFLAADDSPWELLMTVGLTYALPPAAIYYAVKRYMVGGLTPGR